MLQNYFKIAWRSLQRNKAFSFINIAGLAIGLTCCMLITLYIWYECSYDNYHPHIERLYQVGSIEVGKGKETRFQGSPNTVAALLKNVFPQVEATARICPLLGEDKTLLQYYPSKQEGRSFNEEKGFMADSGFFRLFHYHFVEGNAATAISGPYSIVLNKEIAGRLFGKEPALGKVIHVSSTFNGDHDYTVTGVFEPMTMPLHIDARFFLSMYGGNIGDFIKTHTNTASGYFFVTYVRLKPGASAAQVEKGFPAFVNTYEAKDLRESASSRKRFLLNVHDIHLHANMPYGDVTPSGSVTYLYILGSIALFTLLIACINFMNLATAHSTRRSAEVGVRKTLGAKRSSLMKQFLGESLLLALIAFILALGISYLLLPAFNHLSGKNIVLTAPLVLQMAAAFFVLAIVTGLFAGSYPALYLSSFKPVKVLKGKMTNSLAVVSLRKGLVVLQFGISIVLIVAVVIIGKQMRFLRNADLGFTKDQQLILPLRSESARSLYTSLKAEVSKTPGVLSAGASFFYPGTVNFNGLYYAEGKNAADNRMLNINIVDFDFLQTLQLKPVAGHLFSTAFAADSIDGVVVNEEAIRQMGYQLSTCIGKRIYSTTGPESYRIVGVVKDFHFEDLHVPINNIAFFLNNKPSYKYIIAHIDARNMDATIAAIARAWRKLNPTEPFEYSFLDDQFQQHYDADSRLAGLVGYATGIAIVISCLGLFGLAAFSAEQRTKEIGIRKVLGASVANILALISADFLKLIVLAILIGCPVGWYITHKWLQNFAYRTSVTWSVFAITVVVVMVIALLTISFQAIKAAVANPVKSLRTE